MNSIQNPHNLAAKQKIAFHPYGATKCPIYSPLVFFLSDFAFNLSSIKSFDLAAEKLALKTNVENITPK
jgi:hypothetical protein